jgi:D-alanyl-D-alanine dipeptidase
MSSHEFGQEFNSAAKTLSAPIPPLTPVVGWKTVPIQECGEPLVPLGAFSEQTQIFQDSIYYGERTSSPYEQDEIKGSLITCFVREGVAKKLEAASKLLPEGYALLVWDSYRPLTVQKSLFDDFHQQLVTEKKLSAEEASQQAQQFVSIPSSDPTKPSPHNTGASVDLTIVKFSPEDWQEIKQLNEQLKSDDWKIVYQAEMRRQQIVREKSIPLEMGTAFDEVSPKTATRFYEEKSEHTAEEQECLHNRRLLFNVMKTAGFTNYNEEWWHFDSGNQFNAIQTGETAKYGAATFSKECLEWEAMRHGHYTGTKMMQQDLSSAQETEVYKTALVTAQKTGNIRSTGHGKGRRLEVER